MNNDKKEMYQREFQELQRIKGLIEESELNLPEGKLRCEMAHGRYPQYYLVRKEEKKEYPHGRYLKESEIDLARKYAQEEYNCLMVNQIDKREKEIRRFLKDSTQTDLRDVYSRMPDAKKRLIVPYILPDEEYVEKWEKSLQEGGNSYPICNGIITERGELVRSKSEKMIADKLFFNKIPYIYEAKLILGNNKVLYPDFTILNIRTRENYYLEHFGMMDDPEYCKSALEKIDLYENNLIFLGDKLLVTFESSLKTVNLKQIDLMISRFLQ